MGVMCGLMDQFASACGVDGRVEGGAGGSETSTPAVSVGALPWEGTGRRAEWTVLRKEKRAPMVPWFVAPSKGVVEESV